MLPRIKAEDRLEDLRIMFTAAASVQSGSGDSIESLDKQYRSILGVVFQHKAKRSPKADIISFLESANSGKE